MVLDKRISDFGRTKNRISAAQSEIEARAAGLDRAAGSTPDSGDEAIFSVILADQAYQMYNERLAIDFFRYSRAQERRDRFEQFSDLEIAEKGSALSKELRSEASCGS